MALWGDLWASPSPNAASSQSIPSTPPGTPTPSGRKKKNTKPTQSPSVALPDHADLIFARNALEARQLSKLLPTLKVQEGPHKAAHCRVVCGTYHDDGTTGDAWMYVRKGAHGDGWTVAFEKDPLAQNVSGNANSIKPDEVSFSQYLRFELWFPDDGQHRNQATKKAEATAKWKSFLVSVHRLAVPRDEPKYNLTAEQTKALTKQKNERGKRKKQSDQTHPHAQDSDGDMNLTQAGQQGETSYERFSRLHPDLIEMHQIWRTYNSGDVKFNLLDEAVCEVIRSAWCETCDVTGRVGPPNNVLRQARTQRAKGGKCDGTAAFRLWQIKARTGSKIMENEVWYKPTNKLLAKMRATGLPSLTEASASATTALSTPGAVLSWPDAIAKARGRSKEEVAELRREARLALPRFEFQRYVLDPSSDEEA